MKIDLEGKELSKAVGKAYGIEPLEEIYCDAEYCQESTSLWLYEDDARCFQLQCEYELAVVPSQILCLVRNATDMTGELPMTEVYTDKRTVAEATRIAILRHLLLLKSLEEPLIIT